MEWEFPTNDYIVQNFTTCYGVDEILEAALIPLYVDHLYLACKSATAISCSTLCLSGFSSNIAKAFSGSPSG